MEEIKFRGKSEGKWVYGSHVKTGTGLHYIVPQNLISNQILGYVVDKKSVGQYTGLTDKNGKEIYEGDIVSSESYETSLLRHWGRDGVKRTTCYEIKFVRGSFRLCNMKTKDWIAVIDHSGMSKAKDLIVIGNIYENPELLEESK